MITNELNNENLSMSYLYVKFHRGDLKSKEIKEHILNVFKFYEKQMEIEIIDDFENYLVYWKLISEYLHSWEHLDAFEKKDIKERILNIAKTNGFKDLIKLLLNKKIKYTDDFYKANLHFFYDYIYLIEEKDFKKYFYKTLFTKFNFNFYNSFDNLLTNKTEVEIIFEVLNELSLESDTLKNTVYKIHEDNFNNLISKKIGFGNQNQYQDGEYILSLIKMIPNNLIYISNDSFFNICSLYIELGENHQYIKEILRVSNFEKYKEQKLIISEKRSQLFSIHKLELTAKKILKKEDVFEQKDIIIKKYRLLDFDLESQLFLLKNQFSNITYNDLINYVVKNNYFEIKDTYLIINKSFQDLVLMNFKV